MNELKANQEPRLRQINEMLKGLNSEMMELNHAIASGLNSIQISLAEVQQGTMQKPDNPNCMLDEISMRLTEYRGNIESTRRNLNLLQQII